MDPLDELRHLAYVRALTRNIGPVTRNPALFSVAQAFSFSHVKRRRLDKEPLSFIPLSRTTEADDDGAEG